MVFFEISSFLSLSCVDTKSILLLTKEKLNLYVKNFI